MYTYIHMLDYVVYLSGGLLNALASNLPNIYIQLSDYRCVS